MNREKISALLESANDGEWNDYYLLIDGSYYCYGSNCFKPSNIPSKAVDILPEGFKGEIIKDVISDGEATCILLGNEKIILFDLEHDPQDCSSYLTVSFDYTIEDFESWQQEVETHKIEIKE